MTIFTAPAPARTGRRPLVLLGISLGYFMVLLDMTVLAVAEPDLARSLHASTAGLQWATTGYTVVFGALLLSAGAVADRYGAHRVFRLGVAAFGAVSLLSAAAPDLPALVALRAALGAAGAACVPASMALIARLYPEPARRARAVGAWAATSGAAVAIGPVAGGLLVSAAGWRAIFLLNVPVAAVVLALTAGRGLRCPGAARRIDWPGQLLACAGLAALTDTVIALGARSWPHAALSAALTALLSATFTHRERHALPPASPPPPTPRPSMPRASVQRKSVARASVARASVARASVGRASVAKAVVPRARVAPVLDRVLLGSRGVRAGLVAGAAANFALNGALFVLPLVLARGRHLDAAVSGLAFLPLTVPFAVNPPFTSRLVARTGPRPAVLAGLALLGAGGLVLGCAVWSGAGYGWLAAGMLAAGCGVSLVLPAVVAAVIAAAPGGTAGGAGGLLNAVRQVGATLGVALLGSCAATDVRHGAATGLLLAAAACAAAAVLFARTARTAGTDRADRAAGSDRTDRTDRVGGVELAGEVDQGNS